MPSCLDVCRSVCLDVLGLHFQHLGPEFQDNFFDLLAPRACETALVTNDREPTFLQDTKGGKVILGSTCLKRAGLHGTQKQCDGLRGNSLAPEFPSDPVGDFEVS